MARNYIEIITLETAVASLYYNRGYWVFYFSIESKHCG